MPKRCIWLKVTKDKYELPVDVTDTAKEMAINQHTTLDAVRSGAYKRSKGIGKSPYIKVEVEGEDD